MSEDPVAVALAYHGRTRHFPNAYARALPYMDWDTQPDPFRRYVGAPIVLLDRSESPADVAYDAVIEGVLPPATPVDWEAISRLFFNALALSAWKEAGDARWSLRVNPSSGNLHPTEAWLVCGAVPDLGDAPAVYHYNALLHGLERRTTLPDATWSRIAADLPPGACLLALTSIPVRESWKYGERAFRYCQHDVGHALAAVALAAAGLGWRTRLLDSVPDSAVAALLGIAGQTGMEAELPECLLVVYPDAPFPLPQWRHFRLPTLPPLGWAGAPAPLASDHHEWPIIDVVAHATRHVGAQGPWQEVPARTVGLVVTTPTFGALVRRRRSAVEMDGKTTMSREGFLRTMRRLLPGAPPFDALPWPAAVDLLVFVHRVDGLEPGLYALRRGGELPVEGEWLPVDGRLFRLRTGDERGVAQHVSCGQGIAGEGAFSLGMMCALRPGMLERGASFYRRAHWEAGLIGQVLYLEAEREGLRGTGIGCFFDEEMHRAVALPVDAEWRTIYHFTVGGAVDDDRLRTLAPYAHLG